jgi:hypothetical protein
MDFQVRPKKRKEPAALSASVQPAESKMRNASKSVDIRMARARPCHPQLWRTRSRSLCRSLAHGSIAFCLCFPSDRLPFRTLKERPDGLVPSDVTFRS